MLTDPQAQLFGLRDGIIYALTQEGRHGNGLGLRALAVGDLHGIALIQLRAGAGRGADDLPLGIGVGEFIFCSHAQPEVHVEKLRLCLLIVHADQVGHLLLFLLHADVNVNDEIALSHTSRRRILLHDLSRLILGVDLRADFLDLEDPLHTRQIHGLLHGIAQDVRHLICLGAVGSHAAEHQLEQQENHQQGRRKAAENDGHALFIPLVFLLVQL